MKSSFPVQFPRVGFSSSEVESEMSSSWRFTIGTDIRGVGEVLSCEYKKEFHEKVNLKN